MRYLIIILILLIASPSYAVTYAVDKDDGTISIINYNSSSRDSLEDCLKEAGLGGKTYYPVTDLPPQEDREHWTISNGRVVIDQVKKDLKLAVKTAKKNKKKAILTKLGITEQEWSDLIGS